ncbi:oxidoreductase, NAD-binding protein [Amylostereum chailletii]|nr:oxidoreductase, NAD-binding protein [Amylostereum chailletii]
MPINVAVLGYGFSAKVFQLPFIAAVPAFNIKTILQRSSDSCKDDYPNVSVAKSLDQVLADPDIDLVVVSTVNDTHYTFVKRALEAGKHVVVEKPFTDDSSQARELCDLAASKNLVLSVYHNRRWDGDFLTLCALVQGGTAGRPVFWESYFNRYQPALSGNWREAAGLGSGVLYDLGSHLVDQVLCQFGKPASLTAFVTNERQTGPAEVDDSFLVLLHYPALHFTALCRACCLDAASPAPRFTVRFTKGTYTKFGMDPQEGQLMASPPINPATEGFGVGLPDAYGTLVTGDGTKVPLPTLPGRYTSFYDNVAEAIQKKDPSLLAVKPEDALAVVRLLELCRVSAKEGRTVGVDI